MFLSQYRGQRLLAICLTFAISVSHIGGLEMHNNSQAATVLGISENGRQFTVNDHPTFLLGISYYDAVGEIRDHYKTGANLVMHGVTKSQHWVILWLTLAHEKCLAPGLEWSRYCYAKPVIIRG